MGDLWHAIQRLSPGKKATVIILALAILLTWLAVCAILASYLA